MICSGVHGGGGGGVGGLMKPRCNDETLKTS